MIHCQIPDFPMVFLWFSCLNHHFLQVFPPFSPSQPHRIYGTAVNGQQVTLHDVTFVDDALRIDLDAPVASSITW